ncbi:MAG TPA: hypothetical protein VKB94_06240 [Rhizomicrobium sp.]|nr:hypothetical protein [Rhizomicrobium sp.]
MELLAGVTLALIISISATMAGLDRDRGFYPVVLVVVASYYDLFAVMGGSAQALSLETLAMVVFVVASVIGFRTSLWLVVTALVGHGVFDFMHAHLIANPGVPAWWAKFCLSYDIVAGSYLGWLLTRPHTIRAADLKARDGALA